MGTVRGTFWMLCRMPVLVIQMEMVITTFLILEPLPVAFWDLTVMVPNLTIIPV